MSSDRSQGVSQILAVIPARFHSTRFPGKVIAPVAGEPMVLHTYRRASEARHVTRTIIATDDQRVVAALGPFGVPVVMTKPDHPSGTDRVAEVAESACEDIIINVQADEPLINPSTIDATVAPMLDDPELPMATAKCRIVDAKSLSDPDIVKVVCDLHGRALYFSRSPIPYVRGEVSYAAAGHWQHVGLYVYRRAFLTEFSKLARTPLETLENLEQLRAVEHGYPIAVVETEYESIGVDTVQDLERVEHWLKQRGKERTV